MITKLRWFSKNSWSYLGCDAESPNRWSNRLVFVFGFIPVFFNFWRVTRDEDISSFKTVK